MLEMKYRTSFKVISLAVLFCLSVPVFSDECIKWFQRGKIKSGAECSLECSVLPVDMGTFACPSRCPELCKTPISENMLFALTDLYPGLTPAEKALASKYPTKLLQAYRLTWKAEKDCLGKYRRMETNDESDACRHFIWAALMTKEYGVKFAQQILDAHEQEPTQPAEEKAMDLANNQRGVSLIRDADNGKNYSEQEMVDEVEKQLKAGQLVVLKSRYSKEVAP